jgi:type IV pilus assembly protein PilK
VNPAVISRAPDLKSEQLGTLLQRLHTHAGISIDSTKNVIAGCIQTRMKYLGINQVASYLAMFDNSISARAE